MANTPFNTFVTGLPSAGALAGTELVPLVKSGTSSQSTPAAVATFVAANLPANSIANASLAQMASNTIKGNVTAGLANAVDLTVAQVKTLLGIVAVVDSIAVSYFGAV